MYNDFKQIINEISESRKKKFQDGLSTLVSNIKFSQESGAKISPLSFDISSKTDSLYAFVENLVNQAREPVELYSKTRECVEKAYKYTILSGVVTLSVIFPQISSESIFVMTYFFTGIAFIWALMAWIDYKVSMRKLVNLRDKGE